MMGPLEQKEPTGPMGPKGPKGPMMQKIYRALHAPRESFKVSRVQSNAISANRENFKIRWGLRIVPSASRDITLPSPVQRAALHVLWGSTPPTPVQRAALHVPQRSRKGLQNAVARLASLGILVSSVLLATSQTVSDFRSAHHVSPGDSPQKEQLAVSRVERVRIRWPVNCRVIVVLEGCTNQRPRLRVALNAKRVSIKKIQAQAVA